jgi:protein-L-isoaspartate(D-aspartate) O-methyltransferase
VLRVFDLVPRHMFVPEGVQHRAYEDAPVPIGFGQTASQPSLQALYLQVLKLQPTDKVLEIGTGSGYQTALLAHLAGHVYSVERMRELSACTRPRWTPCGSATSRCWWATAPSAGRGTRRMTPSWWARRRPGVPQALIEQLAGRPPAHSRWATAREQNAHALREDG